MVARSVSPQVAAQATTALFLLLSHALACGQLAGAPSLPLVLPLRPAAHTRHSRGGDSAGISASGRRALRSALNKSLPCPIAPPLWGQRVGTPQLARHKWTPQQGKLLILMCDHGQVSNLVACMHNHVIAASLLNRTLVIPSELRRPGNPRATYAVSALWDLPTTRRCVGENRVVTSTEYLSHEGRRPKLDLLFCWYGPPPACPFVDRVAYRTCPGSLRRGRRRAGEHWGRAQGKGVQLRGRGTGDMLVDVPRYTPAAAACFRQDPDLKDVLSEFGGLKEKVIALGDLVAARFVRSKGLADWGSEPHVFLPGCPVKTTIFPSQGLLDQAKKVAWDLFKGAPFLALHFRRGDFRQYCRSAPEMRYTSHACYYSERQAACCMIRAAKRLRIRHLFVATNGKRNEVEQLKRNVWGLSSGFLRVHLLPRMNGGEPWVRRLGVQGHGSQFDLLAMTLEKLVCALSTVFVGSVGSTFSADILRLRFGLHASSCHDSTLCQGETAWGARDEKQRVTEFKKEMQRME